MFGLIFFFTIEGPKLEIKIEPGKEPRAKNTIIMDANLSPIKYMIDILHIKLAKFRNNDDKKDKLFKLRFKILLKSFVKKFKILNFCIFIPIERNTKFINKKMINKYLI